MSTGSRAVCVGWGTLLQAEETGQLPKKERHQTPGPPQKRQTHARQWASTRASMQGLGPWPFLCQHPLARANQTAAGTSRPQRTQTVVLLRWDPDAQTGENTWPHWASLAVCLSPCAPHHAALCSPSWARRCPGRPWGSFKHFPIQRQVGNPFITQTPGDKEQLSGEGLRSPRASCSPAIW